MPRRRRLWEPGNILSVVVRAHEGRPIFATDDDRRFFVARLRVPRVHDERRERRARLLAAGSSVLDLLPPLCARLAADPDAVRRGGRVHVGCRARAIAVHVGSPPRQPR